MKRRWRSGDSFYRANPHRFCKDYLNLELHPFQVVLLFMMNLATNFCFIGSRGLGKTFLTAVFIVYKAILYPQQQIVVCARFEVRVRRFLKR